MRQQRRVVFRLNNFSALCKCRVHITILADNFSRLARRSLQFLFVSVRVPNAMRALFPLGLQFFPSLHRGPSVIRQHRHAAERLKTDRWFERINCRRLLHARDSECRFVVDRLHATAQDRRARHAGVQHSFHARILPVRRFPGAHVFQVVARRAFSDVAPLTSWLQFYVFFFRHVQFRRRRRELSVAQFFPGSFVHHSMQVRGAFCWRHAPLPGGCPHQHQSRGRACLAQSVEETPHRM